jgi:hypothetical protein
MPPGTQKRGKLATHFFSEHNSTCDTGLRMKLSLPTVANSTGKLANSMTVWELFND